VAASLNCRPGLHTSTAPPRGVRASWKSVSCTTAVIKQHGVGPACFCSSRQAFLSSAAPTRPRCVRVVVTAIGASFFR
jgi:hypothetical protein